jgi:biotin carboxyl carrier protein
MPLTYFTNADFTDSVQRIPVTIDGNSIQADTTLFQISVVQEFPLLLRVVSTQTGAGWLVHATVREKQIELSMNGYTYHVDLLTEKENHFHKILHSGSSASQQIARLAAPMPGLIKAIMVQEGDKIRKGDPLFVLEAMKMENAIKAPAQGIVRRLSVKPGQPVEKGALLCMIEPEVNVQ